MVAAATFLRAWGLVGLAKQQTPFNNFREGAAVVLEDDEERSKADSELSPRWSETIAMTADWLCKTHPVVYTGRTADQPRMADFPIIYQQVVRDNPAFFKDVHGYTPKLNTKTGLAGVRSRVWNNTFRDHVLLPALRVYRARTEGASLETVPEVTYSMKPSCDGRSNKSIAQRGIIGFEPRAARGANYVYNPAVRRTP